MVLLAYSVGSCVLVHCCAMVMEALGCVSRCEGEAL